MVAKLHERLVHVFMHSFKHSLASALQMNDVDVTVMVAPKESEPLVDFGEQIDTYASSCQRFTVPINESVTYMLHIDVAQSLHEPQGLAVPGGERTFLLKPVVQIMNVEDTGSVMGAVDMSLIDIDVNNLRCNDPNLPGDGPNLSGNAAYIFDGPDAPLDDIANPETDERIGPLAVDSVDLNIETGDYEYNFAYLLPGTYTIAFTCSTSADSEESDDDFVKADSSDDYVSGVSEFDFDQAINVEVQSNVESNCPIPAGDAPTETCTPTP